MGGIFVGGIFLEPLVFMDDLTFLIIKAHQSLNDRIHIIIHVNKTCY